jgi:hypothetical protein
MILPRGLRSRALDLLQRGGALVSVSNRAKASEADLFRVLSAAGAAELVVVRNQRITSPVRPRPTTTQENQVKVVGALEDLIEQTEAAGGRSALS